MKKKQHFSSLETFFEVSENLEGETKENVEVQVDHEAKEEKEPPGKRIRLSVADQKLILGRTGWFNDNHMREAMKILKKQFPGVGGRSR